MVLCKDSDGRKYTTIYSTTDEEQLKSDIKVMGDTANIMVIRYRKIGGNDEQTSEKEAT